MTIVSDQGGEGRRCRVFPETYKEYPGGESNLPCYRIYDIIESPM